MHARIVLTLILAALALPASAGAATIAQPGTVTDLAAYQGTVVFSQYDDATKQYTLMQRAPGQAPAPVPGVDPADRTFNADIGPDSAGNPAVVYERCDETCDLFITRLDGAGGQRAIRNANDPDHHDVTPTVWNGRIAWSRIYGEQRDRKVIVYTKRLTTPRSTPSTRLPGVPERRCATGDRGTCPTVTGKGVDRLELSGDDLAQIVYYDCRRCSGISQTEVRLVDVVERSSALVAYQGTGMSGQSWVGLSINEGTLSFHRSCLGDPGACGSGQAWRYAISTGNATRGASGDLAVSGFADTGDTLLTVRGCSFETDAEFNKDCVIDERPAPEYDPAILPRP